MEVRVEIKILLSVMLRFRAAMDNQVVLLHLAVFKVHIMLTDSQRYLWINFLQKIGINKTDRMVINHLLFQNFSINCHSHTKVATRLRLSLYREIMLLRS